MRPLRAAGRSGPDPPNRFAKPRRRSRPAARPMRSPERALSTEPHRLEVARDTRRALTAEGWPSGVGRSRHGPASRTRARAERVQRRPALTTPGVPETLSTRSTKVARRSGKRLPQPELAATTDGSTRMRRGFVRAPVSERTRAASARRSARAPRNPRGWRRVRHAPRAGGTSRRDAGLEQGGARASITKAATPKAQTAPVDRRGGERRADGSARARHQPGAPASPRRHRRRQDQVLRDLGRCRRAGCAERGADGEVARRNMTSAAA